MLQMHFFHSICGLNFILSSQVDEEPAIRTNTTILLGNIATYLNEGVSLYQLCFFLFLLIPCYLYGYILLFVPNHETMMQTRKRVLINAFTVRALRDTFPPARGAGM